MREGKRGRTGVTEKRKKGRTRKGLRDKKGRLREREIGTERESRRKCLTLNRVLARGAIIRLFVSRIMPELQDSILLALIRLQPNNKLSASTGSHLQCLALSHVR